MPSEPATSRLWVDPGTSRERVRRLRQVAAHVVAGSGRACAVFSDSSLRVPPTSSIDKRIDQHGDAYHYASESAPAALEQ
eukprot:37595-Eustigmatos_ZCMA.PRE.1